MGRTKCMVKVMPLWYLQPRLANILAIFVTKVLEVTQYTVTVANISDSTRLFDFTLFSHEMHKLIFIEYFYSI